MSKTNQTIQEMLIQRGYKIIDDDDEKIIAIHKTSKNKICAFNQSVLKLNIDRIKEFISTLNKLDCKHCIIVYVKDVTPMAKNFVKTSIVVKMELFKEDELQYNITKHRLVPLHTKLNNNESKKFIDKYGKKIPQLLVTDPVSRFYNFKRNDIIMITRNADNYFIAYRIVT